MKDFLIEKTYVVKALSEGDALELANDPDRECYDVVVTELTAENEERLLVNRAWKELPVIGSSDVCGWDKPSD